MSLLAALMPMIHSQGSQPGNGLLDAFANPLTQMGLGLLATQPSTTPVNPWGGMMTGLQNSLTLRQQEQENALRNQQVNAQLSHYERQAKKDAEETAKEAEKKAAVTAWIEQQRAAGAPPELIALMEANPDAVSQQMAQQQFSNGGKPMTRDRWEGSTAVQEEWDGKQWKEIGRGPRWQPESTRADAEYYTVVSTPNGMMKFNARTGDLLPLTDAQGSPVIKASDDPGLQGQIAGAKKTGEAEAGRSFNMAGIGEVIDSARTILTGDQKPTGSGIGTVADATAGFFGKTLPGAAEADALRSVGGALVTKMPRMEGPQGVLDVELYKEEAGKVGDSTLPVERRLRALQEVERLWRKWDKTATPNMMPSQNMTPMNGNVIRFDAQGNMIQ